MPIVINFEQMLIKRNMQFNELRRKMDTPDLQFESFKNGVFKGIRFETLDKLCEILDCEPGDILLRVKSGKKSGG